jgi:hypothetical protein
MIQNFHFRGLLTGREGSDVVKHLSIRGQEIVKRRLELLSVRAAHGDGIVDLYLRVQGLDRWRIAQHARKFATFLLAGQGLGFNKPLQPYSVSTEGNRRGLTIEEGRTIRERPRNGHGRGRLVECSDQESAAEAGDGTDDDPDGQ